MRTSSRINFFLPVPSLRTQITTALDSLESLREYDRFQEMSFYLAQAKWPGLRLTRKLRDRGADAIDEQNGLVLACGWNGDLEKLRADCRRLTKARPGIKKVVFSTSRSVDQIQIETWRKRIEKDFGIQLVEVMHRDWIIGQLMRQQRWIAFQYLDLPIGDFADLTTYLPRIQDATSTLISAWKDRHSYENQNLIDLRMEESTDPRGTKIESQRADIPALIRPGGLVWLIGQPGAGKTFSLISLADDLSTAGRLHPVLVSVRRWGNHRGQLLEFVVSEPAFQEQGVSAATLATRVKAGKIAFLLNGWNEVPDSQRGWMEDDLLELRQQLTATSCVPWKSQRDFERERP